MDAHHGIGALPRLVPPVRPPPERPRPLLAYIGDLRADALRSWPRQAYEAPTLARRILGRNSLTLCDPEGIRRVLVENEENYRRSVGTVRILRPLLGDGLLISEGAAWRHQRRALAPAFTPRAVAGLAVHVAAAVEVTLAELEREATRGPVALFAALQRLALEIAGRSMFSVAMESHGPELRRFIEAYAVRLGRPHLLDLLAPPGFPVPLDLPRALFRRRWIPFLDRIIAARAAESGPDRPARDLLDLLRSARDPDTDAPFADADLRDQVATMILAGHETTAAALFWALYLLALAPGMQERVAAEAQGADLADPAGCAGDGRLPRTRAVVDETLRLYPPAFLIVRRALAADRVAGHDLAPGDIVMIPPWVLHRHRALWTDPEAFDPGRFLPGAPPPARYAYLPFGVGPRVCIGAQFALTEAVLALARIVGRFRVELTDAEPILPLAVVTTQPARTPPFRLTLR